MEVSSGNPIEIGSSAEGAVQSREWPSKEVTDADLRVLVEGFFNLGEGPYVRCA